MNCFRKSMAERGLIREIFKNFINSLKPRKIWGESRGKDYMGTEYFEIPRTPDNTQRPARWFKPVKEGDLGHEIPPEWESWLRYKRRDPPTEEEIQINLMKMRQVKENAKKLEKNSRLPVDKIKNIGKSSFPIYEDYKLDSEKGK